MYNDSKEEIMENIEKHFCVSVFVYDKDSKKFLLIHHKKMETWVQPGGHIEMNESPEEAAIREVFEETGLKIKILGERKPKNCDYILPLAIQKNYVNDNHIHMDFVYVAYVDGENELILNEKEATGIGWFTLNEIKKSTFNTFPDIIEWAEFIVNNY